MDFHFFSLFSPHLRAASLLDVFPAWGSPVTRAMLGTAWQGSSVLATGLFVVLFVLAAVGFSLNRDARPDSAPRVNFPLYPLLLLLSGASLIYVFAGGFSLDSRKKYVLLPLWLLFGAWLYRAMMRDRRLPRSFCLPVLLGLGMAGFSSCWLVTGIWKHEVARHTELVDLLVARRVSGDIHVQWNPDVYLAWPQFGRTLGFRLDEDWVLNLAVNARGVNPVRISADPAAQRFPDALRISTDPAARQITYDTHAGHWVLGSAREQSR